MDTTTYAILVLLALAATILGCIVWLVTSETRRR